MIDDARAVQRQGALEAQWRQVWIRHWLAGLRDGSDQAIYLVQRREHVQPLAPAQLDIVQHWRDARENEGER